MSIDRLDPVLVHNIVNDLGWRDLHPLQHAAIDLLTSGDDALLLAPTAGGKTEAALFPLLTRMVQEQWTGTSVLYVCPLRALINNLLPRVERYSGWLGRRAELWHGDVAPDARRRIQAGRPDILITTPESLESMLVSTKVDHRAFFAGVQAVVIDEVHAFAGDDRGWHLLAVLERLTHLVGRPLQRVGLSATVGNPEELLTWLQGSSAGIRPARVVAPEQAHTSVAARTTEIELDFVGSLANAARVIAALHRGEKRLVFCESRRAVEELGQLLRDHDVSTFLSHSSLAADERRRSEQAFAESRDCVIVSTSTLELGIDVGDLDRVIQIDAPNTVASLLQRLGRTGRRADTTRNCLFLATRGEDLVKAAGLLVLWGRDWVEPVVAPPVPRHIVAQQLLALSLQESQIGDQTCTEWWNGLGPFGAGSRSILQYLLEGGFLESDGGMLFVGQKAERRFGRRNFMDLTASFTAPPEFTVLSGRTELGRVGPSILTDEVTGPRRLLLGGRSWTVTYIDWKRHRCFVEPATGGGRARWARSDVQGLSFALVRAMRDVLLGNDPPVKMTQRAVEQLAEIRSGHDGLVRADGNVIVRDSDGRDSNSDDLRWWTWAGYRTNATLAATLRSVVDPGLGIDDRYVRLRQDLTPEMWREGIIGAADNLRRPEVDERAVIGLKFSEALPKALAAATLAARLANFDGATAVLGERHYFVHH